MSVNLFEDETQKEIDGYRKRVREILNLFSYGIADGLRWVPDKARGMINNQINILVSNSTKRLQNILQGDIDSFLEKREDEIKKSCQMFYNELFPGKELPADSFNRIIKTLKERAEKVLQGEYIPKLTMTPVMFFTGNKVK